VETASKETAFFDFFAAPVPNLECNALAVIATGLERGTNPRLIKRAASLLQAYEKMSWDANASKNEAQERWCGNGDKGYRGYGQIGMETIH
jgi:hypothetical protein